MSSPRVLVVDDQPHAIRVIRLALARKGYAVDSACDGLEALERLSARRYDVLITDIDMPRMNGRELCDLMHSRFPGATPFTYVVTGGTDPSLHEWAEGLERTRFIEKPLSLKHLTSMLEEHLPAGHET